MTFDNRDITYRKRLERDVLLERAANLQDDPKRAERRKALRCPLCFYGGGGFAGHGFTAWTCKACGKKDMHHNTAVPRLCVGCASSHGACVECGADLELVVHRKERTR